MPILSPQLLADERFQPLIADCRDLVETEIARRGVTIRTMFRGAQRAKPGLVERALQILLPDFARELDAFHAEWQAEDQASFRAYLLTRDREVADALLSVTDRRIRRVSSWGVRIGYRRLRPRARREVTAALPAIADTVARRVDNANRGHPA